MQEHRGPRPDRAGPGTTYLTRGTASASVGLTVCDDQRTSTANIFPDKPPARTILHAEGPLRILAGSQVRMRRLFIVALSLFPWVCSGVEASARDLTFEERVKAQEAIERVYYSHQIGATKGFEEAVPRAVLEKKVRTY